MKENPNRQDILYSRTERLNIAKPAVIQRSPKMPADVSAKFDELILKSQGRANTQKS